MHQHFLECLRFAHKGCPTHHRLTTSPTRRKIVTVPGSTGIQDQAGSVANANGTFAVRALTRNVDGKKTQGQDPFQLFPPNVDLIPAAELKALGKEVVAADWDDVESLKKAFKDAWGVFVSLVRRHLPEILSDRGGGVHSAAFSRDARVRLYLPSSNHFGLLYESTVNLSVVLCCGVQLVLGSSHWPRLLNLKDTIA
jgi:NmrA-like family